MSLNAGVLPFITLARESGALDALIELFPETRELSRIIHDQDQIILQILFGDLTRNHDFWDQNALRDDPAMLMILNHANRPNKGKPQPKPWGKDTIHWFIKKQAFLCKNKKELKKLVKKLNKVMLELFLACKHESVLFLDIDGTDIKLHGNQQHKHYKGNCYMLQIIYCNNFPLSMRLIKADHGSAYQSKSMISEVLTALRTHLGKASGSLCTVMRLIHWMKP